MTDVLTPPNSFEFTDDVPPDTVPPTTDVEYPCEVCGKEAGPYGGRGRKPTRCPEHKKGKARSSAGKVTGAPASLAAQAATVLEQLNGMLAIGAMAVGYNATGHAIAGYNDTFKEAAYEALITDPDLCKLILKGGVKSGKMALAIAYGFMGMNVGPVAMMEYRAKKEARRVAMEDAENATGT